MNSIIVAYDTERTIGSNGALPWQGKMPADMRHFKEITAGTSVIMGRKTFESLPEKQRPLPNRQNIIVSLSLRAIQGAVVAHSLEEAFLVADSEPIVIGGEQIYAQTLSRVQRIYATEIDTVSLNGDAFFPALPDDEWRVAAEDAHPADLKNHYAYRFVTYLRKSVP